MFFEIFACYLYYNYEFDRDSVIYLMDIHSFQLCFGVLLMATIAFAAPQNAAVLPGAWLYNGDQSRKPYYAIEEVILYIKLLNNIISNI